MNIRIVSRLILASGNVVFILCLPLLLVLAVGAHGPFYQGMKLMIVYASLILIPISIIGAWILYRLEAYRKAICFSLLPLVSILLFLLS